MKRAAFYLLYLVVSVSACTLVIEAGARAVMHFLYGSPGKSYGLWISDSELGATHRPNGYNTLTTLNDYGFRNKEDVVEPKPPGSLRIIAFGGSTTFGYNLRDGETYTERLEALLRRDPDYAGTQVLNAGRITYSSAQNLILMKRLVPRLKPDYALLYEGVNEILNAWALEADGRSLDDLKSQYGVIGKSYDYNRWLKRNSLIVRFVDYVVKTRHLEPEGTERATKGCGDVADSTDVHVHPWIIENYRHLLRQMIEFLRVHHVTVIVFRYPSVCSEKQRLFSDLSASIAEEEGSRVCDLQARFDQLGGRKADLFIQTGVHVTAEGAELIAEEVARTIRGLEEKTGRKPPSQPTPATQ